MNIDNFQKKQLYNREEIDFAKDIIEKYRSSRAKSNSDNFFNSIGVTYSDDFSFNSLKRIYYKLCNFKHANFTGTAFSGSRFSEVTFSDCTMEGMAMQNCDFINTQLIGNEEERQHIDNSNISQSMFDNTEFRSVHFFKNTIFQSRFNNCLFENSIIQSTSLESSEFFSCIFRNVEMCNLNSDFAQITNCRMSGVTLAFFQAPYILNLMPYLLTTTDEIWIQSEKSDRGRMPLSEYLPLLEHLCVYFYDLHEYYPLANILIAKKEFDKALSVIKQGITRSLHVKDFRMIKHYCAQIASSTEFTDKDAKQVLYYIEDKIVPQELSKQDFERYAISMDEIRNILLNANYSLPRLEFVFNTNIDAADSASAGEFLTSVNDLLDSVGGHARSKVLALRHNSDFVFVYHCVAHLSELSTIVAAIYAALTYYQDRKKKHRSSKKAEKRFKHCNNIKNCPDYTALSGKYRQLKHQNELLIEQNENFQEMMKEQLSVLKEAVKTVAEKPVRPIHIANHLHSFEYTIQGSTEKRNVDDLYGKVTLNEQAK